jgi:hypothetical protein
MREPLARLFASGDGDKGRYEPQPGDVAVHPQSPSFHAAAGDAADWDGVRFVSEGVARATLCLEPCPHCQTDADELEVDPA